MAIGDLFAVEKSERVNKYKCCHLSFAIRYKLVKNKVTKNFERAYQMQCADCKWAIGQRIAFYRIHDRKNVPIWDNGEKFKERDRIIHLWALENVPFKSKKKGYIKYLSTSRWRKKREIVLKRDKFLCRLCGEKANHIHHLTYDNLGDELIEDLISLCAVCHSKVHSNGNNTRVSGILE